MITTDTLIDITCIIFVETNFLEADNDLQSNFQPIFCNTYVNVSVDSFFIQCLLFLFFYLLIIFLLYTQQLIHHII